MYRFCQILAVLPGSSVDCKRGFSNLNRIKSDDGNKLGSKHLRLLIWNSVFTINNEEFYKLHIPSLIRLWKGQKERRIGGKDILELWISLLNCH